MQEPMQARSVDREDSLEKEMATLSSILAWKSHGQRSFVGYSPWGHKESDKTEVCLESNASLLAHQVKNPPAMQETQETWVWSLDWEDPLEEEMATQSSILACKIPRTEKSGRLQSMGLQGVRHNWARARVIESKNIEQNCGEWCTEEPQIRWSSVADCRITTLSIHSCPTTIFRKSTSELHMCLIHIYL